MTGQNAKRPQIRLFPRTDGRIIVYFIYTAKRVAQIKTVPGRRWDFQKKHWTIPHTEEAIEKLRIAFEGEAIYVDPALCPDTSNDPGHNLFFLRFKRRWKPLRTNSG